MTTEIKVPQLPESVTDATLVTWHKRAGDAVRRDESLAELETDKVVLEVPAPADGVLSSIEVESGATVTSGQRLAVLEPGAENSAPADVEPAEATGPDTAAVASDSPAPDGTGRERLGPAVRRLVEEHDLDPTEIRGTGRDGRITKADVLDYMQASSGPAEIDDEDVAVPAAPAGGPSSSRVEQRVPMSRLRARIAERLVDAQRTAAMLTTFNEVDMSAVQALRADYKQAFEQRHGVKLGFMSFFVKAAVEALRRFPVLNASLDGNDIVYHEYFDIGVAVSTDRGLMVPIVRDVDLKTYAQVEAEIADFGARARTGEIGIEELTGGTFTITNGGIFGSMMSTPILNPPQSGILGMHNIQDRPVVVADGIEARPMMYIALTYDHRLVDGREAVQFLVTVKEQIEDPARLLLQV